MFGIFKKKPAQSEKAAFAIKASVTLINAQLRLSGIPENKAAASRVMSPYSMGYIFGHADAHAQKAGIVDEVQCMAHITLDTSNYSEKNLDQRSLTLLLNCRANRPSTRDAKKALVKPCGFTTKRSTRR